MVESDSLVHLSHLLENIERIRDWTRGLTIDDYRDNTMLRDAVERCLERVSEASRRLPESLKATQPQIPWRKVADIGNVLRHEYDDVADSEVWRIVVTDLDAPCAAIKAMAELS
jgi:uncharacterized protein with HEPN domain